MIPWTVVGLLLLLVGMGGWFFWGMSAQLAGKTKEVKKVPALPRPSDSTALRLPGKERESTEVSSLPEAKDRSFLKAEGKPDSSKKPAEPAPEPMDKKSTQVQVPVIEPASSPRQTKPIQEEPPRVRALPSGATMKKAFSEGRQQDSAPPLQRPTPDSTTTEKELFRLALLHQQTGDHKVALELYRKLLAQNPRNAVALNNMGVIQKEMGQLTEAGEMLRKAIDVEPSYDKAHTNLGVVLQLEQQTQAAIDSHLRALAINDKSWESAVNLGLLLWSEGDLESAKRFFFKALAIQHEASVLHHLGQIFEQQGQSLEAIRHYRQALNKGDGLTSHLRERIQLRLRELLVGNGKNPGAQR